MTAPLPSAAPITLPPLAGSLSDGTLQNAMRARSTIDPKLLSESFESIGASCILPYTQRRLGDFRTSLMAFSMVRQDHLVDAIIDGFANLGRIDGYVWAVRHPTDFGWRLVETSYHINFASDYPLASPPPPNGLRRMARILTRMRDSLMEQIESNAKIFVYRNPPFAHPATSPAMAMAVWAALRQWSDARLLWLDHSPTALPGSAQRLADGLVRGQIDISSPDEQDHHDSVASVLANAWVLFSNDIAPPDVKS